MIISRTHVPFAQTIGPGKPLDKERSIGLKSGRHSMRTLELPLTLFYSLFRHSLGAGETSDIHPTLIARSLLG